MRATVFARPSVGLHRFEHQYTLLTGRRSVDLDRDDAVVVDRVVTVAAFTLERTALSPNNVKVPLTVFSLPESATLAVGVKLPSPFCRV
jgi:hypothetical protein